MTSPFGIPQTQPGNTCWAASAIQALLSLKSITVGHLSGGDIFSTTYAKLLTDSGDSTTLIQSFADIVSNVTIASSMVCKLGDQRDAEEYIMKLVESTEYMRKLFESGWIVRAQCFVCGNKLFADQHEDKILITIPATADVSTDEKFVETLLVHDDDLYQKCSDNTCPGRVSRRLEILETASEIIMVKFSAHSLAKMKRAAPLRFDLQTTDGSTARYVLKAAIETGSTGTGGHYTATVLRGNKWYRCNDDSVANVPPYTVGELTSVVIYERE